MSLDGNGGSAQNYYPNSFDDIVADKEYKEPAMKLDSNIADTWDRNEKDDDHFTQPGLLWKKVMTEEQRKNTVSNLVGSLKDVTGPKKKEIIARQLEHFNKVDKDLGSRLAKGLGIKG
jgi:catalase